MLEAQAHDRLKRLLQASAGTPWPHHLTLTRLVARSLRRGDHSLFPLSSAGDRPWLLSLLVPLALSDQPVALLTSPALRQRLLRQEWPQLLAAGLGRQLWQGTTPPPTPGVWLMDPEELVQIWRAGQLGSHQLVCAEAEQLESMLRQAQSLKIDPQDWDALALARPCLAPALLTLHERLNRRLLGRPLGRDQRLAIAPEHETPLRLLLRDQQPLPAPWQHWLDSGGDDWTGWAVVDPRLLQWSWERQPLRPLKSLGGLLQGRGVILAGPWLPEHQRLDDLGLHQPVVVPLGDLPDREPLPVYVPAGQPLPNHPDYPEHLLAQARRLILGQAGVTIVLVEDDGLRHWLASALAAEFGRRVDHEQTAPESNGVICCRWQWWLERHALLPGAIQLLVGPLPIASMEDPLTAARVGALRRQGRDCFRELLLPEALERLQRGVEPLRDQGFGRLALLDGRVRGRSWGQRVLEALDPWQPLEQLRPA
jgi:ATP-dependent DNA helicase DinG